MNEQTVIGSEGLIPSEPTDLEGVVMNEGLLTVDLAGLPPGSLVTITVRVGPEAPAPQAEPPAQAKRYMGQGRINKGGA